MTEKKLTTKEKVALTVADQMEKAEAAGSPVVTPTPRDMADVDDEDFSNAGDVTVEG